MRCYLSFLFALAAVNSSLAATGSCYQSYYKGTYYYFEFNHTILKSEPFWAEDKSFPPMSPRKAEKLARAYLTKLIPDKLDWETKSISLDFKQKGKWVYLVRFKAKKENKITYHLMRIPVLMSGKIVDPRIVKEK